MNYRPLGRTGLMVSEIGFGGWAIGGNAFGNSYGETDDDTSRAAIRAALDAGVNLFDTADIYGHGHSEALLSEVLEEYTHPSPKRGTSELERGAGGEGDPPGTQAGSSTAEGHLASGLIREVRPVIVTKGGINFYRPDGTLEQDWTPYGVAHALQQSLYRLRRETLDVFLLMNPPVREMKRWHVWETLEALRRADKVRFYGVSVAEPEDGIWLLHNHAPIDVIEVTYSIFYQAAMIDLFPMAEKAGVGILAREPLANGFLAERDAARTFTDGDIRGELPPEYVDAMREMAGRLNFLSDGTGRTPAQAALRFALDERSVSSVVVGAKTPEQVQENVAAINIAPITDDERRRISEVFSE
jgi:aryl-alcohol dehydrogenase-like predicted oxidoreductase